ncbi:MBL fold metallo-hydrolase [Kitasatospora terrestris]|uniref:MBL fold metallo-hydrolase n=1 Tax=Kitasatospora terrestris TaxID=258051 RepID=A0ABP9EDX5_9ACTN
MDGIGYEAIVTAGLGDSSYLLVSGDEAAYVDPQRDCWPVLEACRRRGVRVRYVLETHVHNDYLSGALEVREATGATVAGPAAAGYGFAHLPLVEDDEVAVGDAVVRALETPGHTAEHTAYLVHHRERPQDGPEAVFTGGSLLVGASGRTDLLGPGRTEELTRAQYRSLRRLAALPDATRVLPTHGAGSSCAAAAAPGARTSTVGAQRLGNPGLLAADEAEFLAGRLRGLPPVPGYYRHMAPINRAGPPVLGHPPVLPPLTPGEAEHLALRGATVVDARDRRGYADAHLPGSLGHELDDAFAAVVGETVPFGTDLVLVLPEPLAEAAAEAVRQLLRIGYRALGHLAGGVGAWAATGRPVASFATADVRELAARGPGAVTVLDVRTRPEPPVPGALAVPLGQIAQRAGEFTGEVWTVCGRGRRAAVAAGLLARAGVPVTAVVTGGAADLIGAGEERRTGR